MVDTLLRNFFLHLSRNRVLNHGAKRWGFKFGASQVVAGNTIEEALEAVAKLNEQGLKGTVDHLGEFVNNKEEAEEAATYCVRTLRAIKEANVDCNLSLKLTQLGLDMDWELCLNHMRNITETAAELGNFVRIDMEDYSHCAQTIELLEILKKEYPGAVGTVIQAYLHRAVEDVERLKGTNLRLVKGAYKESQDVAYQDKKTIDRNFYKLIKQHLLNDSYTAIATHDHRIIGKVKAFCKRNDIDKAKFEFQMLYGFRTELQQQIANEGYTMRVYVPFGKDWYGYFMRRLAERPQNVAFAFRGLIKR